MVLLRFLVYYAIPLVVIAIFYALIARHLMYAAHVPGEQHGAVKQVRAIRDKWNKTQTENSCMQTQRLFALSVTTFPQNFHKILLSINFLF